MRKIFIVWLITIWNVSAEFCDKKNLPSQNSNAILKEYCSKNNGSLSDRQCVYKNKTLGLDLSHCGVNKMIELPSDVKKSVQWIAINDNNFGLDDTLSYLRSSSVQEIVINLHENCTNFNHTVSRNNLTLCYTPLNQCDTHLKNPCPSHSLCGKDGPGLFTCDCVDDWKSYKCLKKKGFPKEIWLISIAAATIVMIVIIRLLQVKDRKRGEEFKKLARTADTNFLGSERSDKFE